MSDIWWSVSATAVWGCNAQFHPFAVGNSYALNCNPAAVSWQGCITRRVHPNVAFPFMAQLPAREEAAVLPRLPGRADCMRLAQLRAHAQSRG